ncbi:MAG: TonB-dependent receptor plug domain-containing protein [Elusimicrobia bacterium]|nr:TonB-dependent receptor plug domain-containing protein [Elusimicrobiota bacterium]
MRLFFAVLAFAVLSSPCRSEEAAMLEPVVVLGARIQENPSARAIGRVERGVIESVDAFSLKDLMDKTPGVLAKQSNGPRDVSISVRGSGAKTSFAIRNIKMYEDWFPVTQSDGLSRTDIHDPNAYEGIDVLRGPSSSLHDNYALGGAVNFRTRLGRDVDGLDAGVTAGSYGYQNERLHLGRRTKSFEYSAFVSHIRADGYTYYNGYKTVTENVVGRFYLDESRTVVFKFLNNDMEAQVPSRLSRAQMDADPRSAGLTNVTGVGSVSAERASQSRRDRRTILGGRYEQRLDPETGWRFLGAYDVKDIDQTFGTISDTVNPNFHQYADVTREGTIGGLSAKHYAGVFFNRMEQESASFRNLADWAGTRGALQSSTRGFHQNLGFRLREELEVSPRWTAIAGLGVERSQVKAAVRTRTGAETYSRADADRVFHNAAPEAALSCKAEAWTGRARAGMGYGTPGIGQLTTTPDGLTGNNTGLKPQRNLGFEAGAGGKSGGLSWDAAAYYEVYWNEFVTQTPGAGLGAFTANAPRADHRGAELWADWRSPEGLLLAGAWTFNDHVYRTFRESAGGGLSIDRAGSRVPGVERSVLNARAGWDRPGLPGGWVEANQVSDYAVNNANTLRARRYTVLNLNAHWKRGVSWGPVSQVTMTFDLRNLMNIAYDGSAVTVADASSDTPASLLAKQAFFAGQGRSAYGGLTFHF